MAGHSKWANIRFRKGAQDAKRGKVFTKIIREITMAARTGGGDPSHNPRLRAAIDKGLAQNMPKDNIERAIKRGTGEIEGATYEDVTYEGYGPGGVAVLVECATDNRHRTVGEVRHAFAKHGGNLGAEGSVAYLFKRLGVIAYDAGADEERILEVAIDAGAQDVAAADDGSLEVLTTPETFHAVKDALIGAGLGPEHAEVTERASVGIKLAGEEAEQVSRLLEALEDLDDVQNVYANAEFPSEMAGD